MKLVSKSSSPSGGPYRHSLLSAVTLQVSSRSASARAIWEAAVPCCRRGAPMKCSVVGTFGKQAAARLSADGAVWLDVSEKLSSGFFTIPLCSFVPESIRTVRGLAVRRREHSHQTVWCINLGATVVSVQGNDILRGIKVSKSCEHVISSLFKGGAMWASSSP